MVLQYKNIKNNDISTIDMPPGVPGMSKNLEDQAKDVLVSWSAKIHIE